MTWWTPNTYTSGTQFTSGLANADMRDNTSFLAGKLQDEFTISSFSLLTSTYTTLTGWTLSTPDVWQWRNFAQPSGSSMDAGTMNAGTGVFTPSQSGIYHISYFMGFSFTAGADHGGVISFNNADSTPPSMQFGMASAGNGYNGVAAETLAKFNGTTDNVRFKVQQNSGSTQTVYFRFTIILLSL